MNRHDHVNVGGAPEGYDAWLVVRELRRQAKIVLHIARDDRRLAAMQAALAFWAPDIPVFVFPAWDCLPYDRLSPSAEVCAARMATLTHLTKTLPSQCVLLTTLNAAMQKVPQRQLIRQTAWSAQVGTRIDVSALATYIQQMGFRRVPTVTEPGDFAVRGGLTDIFLPGQYGPVRLDLFGDVLESARRFDPATQRTVAKLDSVDFAPVNEVVLDQTAIARFRRNYRAAFGVSRADDPLYEAVSAGRKMAGVEHWLGLFHERLETIFDYLPGASITVDDQVQTLCAQRCETVARHYDQRLFALKQKKQLDTVYNPAPPKTLYLDETDWKTALVGRRLLWFSPTPPRTGPGVIDAGGRLGRSFAPERQPQSSGLFAALALHIKARLKVGPVILASYSPGTRQRLAGMLDDEGLKNFSLTDDIGPVYSGDGLHLMVWALDAGFEAPGLTVISEQDVLGARLIRPTRQTRRAENFLTEAQSLSPGDLVVHVDHGIGRYQGLEVVTAAGAAHECLALEYADGAKLYLPVENIDLLSRYGQDHGVLDRLGGSAWQARKARLKQRIQSIAKNLIRVAAQRALRKAPRLPLPDGLWDQFLTRFAYQETDDQLQTIGDVLADMDSGTPMDRLVCGDVGYGKTEVALRAAFVAAMAGVQVAVIVPTTLLARQHYREFSSRLCGFSIQVRQLSRFVSPRDAAQTRAGLVDGTIDVVIGTHMLLGKSVRFARLGLLIIDEEQHFGVKHKEQLKHMRTDVHVLTLTATPIPRTLQLSLAGVRDLSIIGTPPVDRLSIRTYVGEFDVITIRDALLREHFRGGQSFFIVPRIADLDEMEDFLKTQMPEIRYVIAHGQMATSELDRRMNAFYDGAYDVLLSTSIVESGLDIPNANTMIVYQADRFGLAQLYQIRGRVGRAKTRAYAYLTTRPRAVLTPAAAKRLRVLGSIDALGAGFTLAAQDLDIRGAGNILGDQQSGHIREVGYELYQQMLEEEIARIKAGTAETPITDDGAWSPQINLGLSVLIPQSFVPDLDVRLALYRRLSRLSTKVELEGFAAELIDRFGPLPKEVDVLLLTVKIKTMCKRAGIAKLDGGPKGAIIQFHNNKFSAPAGLVEFITAQRGLAKIRDHRLIVRRDWRKDRDKVRGAFAIARDLARKLAQAKTG